MGKILDLFTELLDSDIVLSDAFNISLVAGKIRPGTLMDDPYDGRVQVAQTIAKRHFPRLKSNSGFFDEVNPYCNFSYKKLKIVPATSNKQVGKYLGLLCPGELDGQFGISMFVTCNEDRTLFYGEMCKKLSPTKRKKAEQRLKAIRRFIAKEQLPCQVVVTFDKSWNLEHIASLLHHSEEPISKDTLEHLSNNVSGDFPITEQIMLRLLEQYPNQINYRPLLEQYTLVWAILFSWMSYFRPILEQTFSQDTYEAFPQLSEIMEYDEVENAMQEWEHELYALHGFEQ